MFIDSVIGKALGQQSAISSYIWGSQELHANFQLHEGLVQQLLGDTLNHFLDEDKEHSSEWSWTNTPTLFMILRQSLKDLDLKFFKKKVVIEF